MALAKPSVIFPIMIFLGVFGGGAPVLIKAQAGVEQTLRTAPNESAPETGSRLVWSTESSPALNPPAPTRFLPTVAPPTDNSPDAAISLVTQLGKIWDIIFKNRAHASYDVQTVSALPTEARGAWDKLSGWVATRDFGFEKDVSLFGVKFVKVRYRVQFTFGGQYQGHGKYLAQARVIPEEITVYTPYQINLKGGASVINVGTPEEPLAKVRIDLFWNIRSPVSSHTQSEAFEVYGDGRAQNLTTQEWVF